MFYQISFCSALFVRHIKKVNVDFCWIQLLCWVAWRTKGYQSAVFTADIDLSPEWREKFHICIQHLIHI